MKTMRIRLTRLSSTHHALEILRDSGASERVELETRSYLLHDFLHYAAESAANLQCGVFGTLASGKTLADLNDRTGHSLGMLGAELQTIELITGVLHSIAKQRASAQDTLAAITALLDAQGKPRPDWLCSEFIKKVSDRLRALEGHWRATPLGEAMELHWPPAAQKHG
jgi:hypothetical protein